MNGKYSIKDLVDIDELREIFEKFSKITGYTTGFVSYPELEILIDTGWRDICTLFHRANPEAERICKKSNEALLGRLNEVRELSIEKCGHGLVDGATPVIINGTYIASVATGQVFFEEPDLGWFRSHAEKQGFDVEKYLEAVKKVPVVNEEKFKEVLTFLSEIAAMICDVGFHAIVEKENAQRLKKEIKKREDAEVALLEHQDHLEDEVEKRTEALTFKIKELEEAIAHIKRLEGLVPICSRCKKMLQENRDSSDPKAWVPLEKYISERSEAEFTHGLCPECIKKMYEEREA